MTSDKSSFTQEILPQVRSVIDEMCQALGVGELLQLSAIASARLDDGHVFVTWQTAREAAPRIGAIVQRLEAALEKALGVKKATIILTSHRPEGAVQGGRAPRQGGGHRPFALADGSAKNQDDEEGAAVIERLGAVIAVASGKGGVGKSTTAINIAVGLAQKGLRVGMLDADIYGPSLPRMLGHRGRPEIRDGKIIPIDAWGVKAISIGFMVDEEQAVIWRGPMVMGAINQFINDVAWPDLDVTVIDMPPGTGDAQLSIAQKLPLAGAVIISTPQDIALLDARRGVTMFQQLRVPILGLVENMSYFCCPHCHHRTELFSHGGARAAAAESHLPFLGEVPLLAEIRQSGDAGEPIIMAAPDGEAALRYKEVAEAVLQQINAHAGRDGA
ncbi:Mrp/NBP35 family ATP-binding protein [Candidatus Kirkpatrickella diaphorinae]